MNSYAIGIFITLQCLLQSNNRALIIQNFKLKLNCAIKAGWGVAQQAKCRH